MTEGQKKILLVEDEAGIAQFIWQGLAEENLAVSWENDGKSGMETALSQKFDVILLDWMLPNYSGLDICKAIREKEIETPVIFLTARDTVHDTVNALHAGADDYIKKPFHFEELLARIEVQLRKSQWSDRDLVLGNILIKSATREVFLDEKNIHLTQKEFDLLYYLISHKNEVCERKKIIEDVWDIHFEYDNSVLDVYMNSIRKKLNINKDDERLQTIRGVGFMAKEN